MNREQVLNEDDVVNGSVCVCLCALPKSLIFPFTTDNRLQKSETAKERKKVCVCLSVCVTGFSITHHKDHDSDT